MQKVATVPHIGTRMTSKQDTAEVGRFNKEDANRSLPPSCSQDLPGQEDYHQNSDFWLSEMDDCFEMSGMWNYVMSLDHETPNEPLTVENSELIYVNEQEKERDATVSSEPLNSTLEKSMNEPSVSVSKKQASPKKSKEQELKPGMIEMLRLRDKVKQKRNIMEGINAKIESAEETSQSSDTLQRKHHKNLYKHGPVQSSSMTETEAEQRCDTQEKKHRKKRSKKWSKRKWNKMETLQDLLKQREELEMGTLPEYSTRIGWAHDELTRRLECNKICREMESRKIDMLYEAEVREAQEEYKREAAELKKGLEQSLTKSMTEIKHSIKLSESNPGSSSSSNLAGKKKKREIRKRNELELLLTNAIDTNFDARNSRDRDDEEDFRAPTPLCITAAEIAADMAEISTILGTRTRSSKEECKNLV